MKVSRIFLSLFIIFFCGTANTTEQAELFARKWYLGILNQEPLIMTNFTDQKPYLQFEKNNSFTAFVGCTKIHGTFVLIDPDGLQLQASSPVYYDVNCKQDFIDLENKFIKSLPNVKVWEITNGVLYFKNNINDIISIAIFMPNEPY